MAMNPRFAAAHGIAEDPIADASIADPLDRVMNDRPSSSFVVVPAKRPSTRPNAEEHPAETVPASREPAAGTDATRVEPNAYRDEDEDIPEDLPDENAARATNGQKADMSDGEDDSTLDTRLDAFPPSGTRHRASRATAKMTKRVRRSDAPAESASPTKAKKQLRADASIRASRPSPRKSFAADAFDLETLRSAALEAETEFVDARAYAPGPEAPPETLAAAMARARAERALDATSRVSGVSSNERTDRMNDGPSRDDSSRDDSSHDIPTTAAVESTPPVATRRVASTPAGATVGRSPRSRAFPRVRRSAWTWRRSCPARFARGTPPTPARRVSRAGVAGRRRRRDVRRDLRARSRRSGQSRGAGPKGTREARGGARRRRDDLSARAACLRRCGGASRRDAGDGAVTRSLRPRSCRSRRLCCGRRRAVRGRRARFGGRSRTPSSPRRRGRRTPPARKAAAGGAASAWLAGEGASRARPTRGALLGQVDALESLAVAAEGDMALRARGCRAERFA